MAIRYLAPHMQPIGPKLARLDIHSASAVDVLVRVEQMANITHSTCRGVGVCACARKGEEVFLPFPITHHHMGRRV